MGSAFFIRPARSLSRCHKHVCTCPKIHMSTSLLRPDMAWGVFDAPVTWSAVVTAEHFSILFLLLLSLFRLLYVTRNHLRSLTLADFERSQVNEPVILCVGELPTDGRSIWNQSISGMIVLYVIQGWRTCSISPKVTVIEGFQKDRGLRNFERYSSSVADYPIIQWFTNSRV